MLLLFVCLFFAFSFFEENKVYKSYALFNLGQCMVILGFVYLFKKRSQARWLVLGVTIAVTLYILERYFLGGLIEPMKGQMPTIVGTGAYQSPGLVKVISMYLPTLYLCTKIAFFSVWIILSGVSLSLKKVAF